MMIPAGAYLAPPQRELEREWKTALERDFGITFDRLLALNNMPISRFLEWLTESNNLDSYMARLIAGFNADAVAGLMCRNTISVSWDGRLFDCDFNQMLDLDAAPSGAPMTIETFDFERWQARQVVTRPHCFGCTAGAGSSCGGAPAELLRAPARRPRGRRRAPPDPGRDPPHENLQRGSLARAQATPWGRS